MSKEVGDFCIAPERIYRNAKEIERDVRNIKIRSKEVNERFNLRSLLIDLINDMSINGLEESALMIPELEIAIAEAREAYSILTDLNTELTMLEEELREARCAMGI